jgi:AraC-like DNA-binding protein
MTLSTLVLPGEQASRLERMLECLAQLMGACGKADELTNEIYALRLELEKARLADRMWSAVADMLNESSFRGQYSAAAHHDLAQLGLARPADQVLVGLSLDRSPSSDPVDAAIRRDALQRAAVELARAAGNVVAGRVGDNGIVFLSAERGSVAQRKKKLDRLGHAASVLARDKLGLSLHFGSTESAETLPLLARYQASLSAAESALSRNLPSATAASAPSVTRDRLRLLRAELTEIVEVQPELLPARFDRYLEAVAARTGYLPEPARIELELCFERIAEVLLRSGVLDSKSFSGMRRGLDRALGASRSTHELFAAYRRAVLDMAETVRKPSKLRQELRLRTALDYVQQNFGEPLSRKKVAKMSGFAPTYFSELFVKLQGKSFEEHVFSLRFERAKQLLSSSDLSATRVAELSGFRSPQYLCRVFQKTLKKTPLEFRYATRTWEKPPESPSLALRTKRNRPKDKAR